MCLCFGGRGVGAGFHSAPRRKNKEATEDAGPGGSISLLGNVNRDRDLSASGRARHTDVPSVEFSESSAIQLIPVWVFMNAISV